MSRSIVVRVATLLLAVGGVSAAILYGCSKPAPQTASQAGPAAPTAPSAEASDEPEDDPAYLGATKAAVVVKPKKPQQQKK